MAGQIGTFVLKKGTQMATKKFLNKQMELNKDRKPGGQWVRYSYDLPHINHTNILL